MHHRGNAIPRNKAGNSKVCESRSTPLGCFVEQTSLFQLSTFALHGPFVYAQNGRALTELTKLCGMKTVGYTSKWQDTCDLRAKAN